jgi:hypothetical protein
MTAVDLLARELAGKAREEASMATTAIGRMAGEVSRLSDKTDEAIDWSRKVANAQRDTANAVARLDHAFRKQFGSLSEEVTAVATAEAQRIVRRRKIVAILRKCAVGALIGFSTVVGAALAISGLKHCGVSAPNTIEVSP